MHNDMKSKITIDFDWDNQPIIRIEYEDSPDVRDKLVKRFMESFGGGSCFATFFYDQPISDMTEKVNRRAVLRPIKHSDKTDQMLEIHIREEVKH